MNKQFAVFLFACSLFIALLTLPFVKVNNPQKNIVNQENEEDGMELAMEQEFRKTQDPALHRIPTERLAVADRQVTELMQRLGANFRTTALSWTERGPNNIGGRTRAVLVDANDGTGNTIFTGSVGGGIWKCTNFTTGGYTWNKIDDNMANLAVTALAQDPTTPNTMYAGTGEGFYNADAIKGGGIFKSTNGGATWTVLPNTVPGTSNDFDYVQDIVVTASGHIYAATRGAFCNSGGILKSTNGGTSWTNVLGSGSGSCANFTDYVGSDLEIAANGDLYCTTGLFGSATNTYSRIFKSAAALGAVQGNSGQWTNITPTPPAGDAGFRRIELACAPSNNQYLYAMCQTFNGNGIRRCYRSTNGGTGWTEITPPTWCDQGANNTDMTRGQAWYDLIAAFDPTTTNNVFIGGVDIMKSTNEGTSFSQLTQWATGCASLPYVHADIHNIVFIGGSASKMIIACDGGIFYSSDGGTTFTEKNSAYNITQYYGVAIHPSNPNYFLAGAQDNGTHRIISPGIGSGISFTGGDGGISHIDKLKPWVLLSAYTRNYVAISRNGGSSLIANGIGDGSGQFINASDYDERTGILYMGDVANTIGRIINVVSGTPTFNFNTVAALSGTSITAVKVDPNASNTVWVGGSGSGAPVILKLTNANAGTPTATNVSIAGATSGSYVSSIDVEKDNSNHVLVTFSNYGVVSVFETTNGGTTWTAVEGTLPDMPVRWGIFLPAGSNEGVIALATELGVFTTTVTSGGTTTWVANNNGFPKVKTNMLKYRQSDNTLVAATHGRGIFNSTLGITPVTWNGSGGSAWTTPSSWTPARVPGITDEVVIPNVGTLPVVTTSQKVGKLTINASASITLNSTITVASNLVNNGTVSGTGSIVMAGFAGQTISGNGSIKNLTTNNNVTITSGAGNMQSITGVLTISSDTLTTNSNLTLKSTSISNTAMIGVVGSNGLIQGDVTIERYIPASNRAFRLIAPGVTTTTSIRSNWQEGVNVTNPSGYPNAGGTLNNPNAGYGTHITGSTTGTNGFDATTTGSGSLFTFNNSSQAWVAAANTSIATLNAQTGYRLLIRGDRSLDLRTASPTVNATTLRATGTVSTGNVSITGLASAINQYSFIGNPYWAAVDWTLMQALTSINISTTYWIWDPTIAGSNGRGGYTSFTSTGPGTGTPSGGGSINKNIQPGQAFFVRNTAASPTLTFTENYKDVSTALTSTFRTSSNTSGTDGMISLKLFLKNNLEKQLAADGVSFAFRNDFKKGADAFDAEKIANPDESISFNSNNKSIGFDARPVPNQSDTLFLNMGNMLSKEYILQFEGSDFSSNIVLAYMYDSYLKKKTYIQLNGKVNIPYTIDANPQSANPSRFYIVLNKGNASLPLTSNDLYVSVFPNPVSTNMILAYRLSEMVSAGVQIHNAAGQLVQQLNLAKLEQNVESINVQHLKAGMYTITLTAGKEKKTLPFIKL